MPLFSFIKTRLAPTLPLCLLISLPACQNYSLKLNGNALNAEPVFSNFVVADKHLAACIKEHLFDQHATKAEDLKQLYCPQRSIKSLQGLETFNHLLSVKINGNAVTTLAPLMALSSVEEVNLEGNPVDCGQVNNLRTRGVRVVGVCNAKN